MYACVKSNSVLLGMLDYIILGSSSNVCISILLIYLPMYCISGMLSNTHRRPFEKCLLALTTLNTPEASNSHEPSVGDKSYGVS